MRTFLPAMCAAFFMRVRPASRKANPACMNMTRIAATTTQSVLAAIRRFALLIAAPPRQLSPERPCHSVSAAAPRSGRPHRQSRHGLQAASQAMPRRRGLLYGIASDASSRLHRLERPAGAVVGDVFDAACPDEAVARLVARPRGVRDRFDHSRRDLVVDDEREQCLRQEARFEDTPPVLVRDAALASVTDRLDHRDADVACLLLDGVDHGFDALADDYGFDLDHSITSLRRSRKMTSRQLPSSCPIRSRMPTSRKPKRFRSARLGSFSGKTPVSSVQMPACSVLSIRRSSSAAPMPRPRAFVPT